MDTQQTESTSNHGLQTLAAERTRFQIGMVFRFTEMDILGVGSRSYPERVAESTTSALYLL
jgi:hypothetical protein